MTNRPIRSTPVSTGNPDLIREDIERTRDDLGQTMEALAAKTDVKARTRHAADHAKAQAREKVAEKAHSMQHQSGEFGRGAKAGGRAVAHKVSEGVQRARRHPAGVPTAATAAGAAAAAAGTVIFLRRRRAAKAGARRSIWRRWQ